MSQWTINTSSGHYVRPTSFLPERWLKPTPAEFASDQLNAAQPSSLGPRSCIGKNLALAEVRLILGRLVWNFDISVPVEGKRVMAWSTLRTFFLVEKKPLEVQLAMKSGPGDLI